MVFHQALVDATDNVILVRSYANLRVRQRRIPAGDDVGAVAAVDAHLDRTLPVLLQA